MILDTFRLDDLVAVVTGGTKGLGRAMALALAEAGAQVAVVSRTDDPELAGMVTGLGRRYLHIEADLTQRAATRRVIPAALAELGTVDILVNNAGIIRRTPAVEYPIQDWDATLEIDLTAAFILAQAAGEVMLKKRPG